MSKIDKEIERLKSKPKDFTYDEAKKILNHFGFYENNKGRTSGSRVEFRDVQGRRILFHKPHPQNILKLYQVSSLLEDLIEMEVI